MDNSALLATLGADLRARQIDVGTWPYVWMGACHLAPSPHEPAVLYSVESARAPAPPYQYRGPNDRG